ncbi:hypothetical protein OAP83_00655 [Rickettsiales bacterium]|nr:hypothetical protein [Rickettsiales bacterium]
MKCFKFLLPLIMLSFVNAYAFDFDKALDKVTKDSKGGLSIDKIADNIEDEVSKRLDKVENKIEKRAKDLESKLTDEVHDKLSDFTEEIESVRNIKAKADRVIFISKIVGSIFSLSFIFLLFMIWRLYRKLTTLYKLMDNVRSYQDIEKRVAALEKSNV